MSYTPPKTWAEVPHAVREALLDPFVKNAEGEVEFGADGIPGLKHLADLLGWRAGPISSSYGGPRPLSNLLIGAGLGSLGGYGVGRLAEEVLPRKYFDKGTLRKRTRLLGGILGTLPAAWQAYDNYEQSGGQASSIAERWPIDKAAFDNNMAMKKTAFDLFDPMIHRDRFNRDVMAYDDTPMHVRAATAGLVEAASATARSPIVTPWGVAGVAVGAGSGLVSGILAGKALGFLAGLNPAGQSAVQQAGLWSGVLNVVVPRALGFR